MPEPNGIEAMMTRMLESQIQLAQNLVLMDTRHHETILRIDQKFERIDQTFERIEQRFEQLEERMARIEQKIDALPEEVYRKQIGFQQQS